MPFKAVIFDYIGTLINCRNYTMDASKQKLCNALIAEGFDINKEMFLTAYDLSHEKYRKVRYEQLREVTNAVWVAEALGKLGFNVTEDNPRIKAALNIFFQDFIDTLELREGAKKLLHQTQKQIKVGLISNFTYAPAIYKSLRKMGICKFFNIVVVSQQVGWRKPSSHIFQFTLKCLKIQPNEAVYIGDSPNEDIKGAKEAGLKTVFVPSQFNSLKDLKESKQEPDLIAKDLIEICKSLSQILSI
ncbi:HAD family hydrolase [Candidatus Bathyarchaeota archaeon]|nr:MAG: HAD family hydrolase [Candidatus Bathyarchaeota archaeon]